MRTTCPGGGRKVGDEGEEKDREGTMDNLEGAMISCEFRVSLDRGAARVEVRRFAGGYRRTFMGAVAGRSRTMQQ